MNNIDRIFAALPEWGIAIIGEAGELWSDKFRFSTHKPILIQPDFYKNENFEIDLKENEYNGLVLTSGLSAMLQNRRIFQNLLDCVKKDGMIIGVEADKEIADGNSACHISALESISGFNILSSQRIKALLKETGITNIKTIEIDQNDHFLKSKSEEICKYLIYKLKKTAHADSMRLIELLEKGDYHSAPLKIYIGNKSDLRVRTVKSDRTVKLVEETKTITKILNNGVQAFDTEELISTILNIDIAASRNILFKHGGKALLKEEEFSKMGGMLGIEDEKAAQLLAILEIGRRLFSRDNHKGIELHSPEDAVSYLSEMKFLKKEQIRVLYLSQSGGIIWDEVAAIGKFSHAMVSPRELLAPAIEHSAAGLILAHNHPSGKAKPSREDIELTIKVENAAELLNIDLWDHLIIASENYFSFNENGKIKNNKFIGTQKAEISS